METTRIKQAIQSAISSKGSNKGYLKKQCPAIGSDAAGAWQAIMRYANPYKVGIGHYLFMPDDVKEQIYNPICAVIEAQQIDVRHLDRDRKVLDILGVF